MLIALTIDCFYDNMYYRERKGGIYMNIDIDMDKIEEMFSTDSMMTWHKKKTRI